VPGYQFTPQFRAKLWDGKIRLYESRTRQMYRGLVPYIKSFCEDRDYDFKYETVQESSITLSEAKQFAQSINCKYEPRDYQLEAFVHAINKKRALLLSPTASGKSLIIYLIMRYINVTKILIIVPTTSLVSQLYSDFSDYGYDSDNCIHTIFAGRDKQSDMPVTISTWQSLYELPSSYFQQYDAVIGDEAHLFKAKSLTHIMTSLTNAKYRIGTTGTLDGTKTNKLVLEGLFGPVKKVITTKELMDQKHVADFSIKCLLLKHSNSICQAAKNFTYQQEIEYLVLNESRNKFIANLALSLSGNTLVLYQYVDKHGKILYDLINRDDRKVFFIYGKTDVEIREEVRHIMEKETNAIIVASYGTTSTGVNIRNLHNIIFASPSKSRIRNLQSIGRSLRTSETKTSATLYDIADDLRYNKKENYTLRHLTERIKIYSEEKFSFKLYKLDLKGN
jgi:superfamily II DNA or RNA helicase